MQSTKIYISRKGLGKNVLGSIFSFLDIINHAHLLDEYPESCVVWKRYTQYETVSDESWTMYLVNNKRHRVNAPARTSKRGEYEWYYNDKCHRVGGPAVERNGNKYWFHHGKEHRDNGPASISAIGSMRWYKHGCLHCTDGPAVIYGNFREWWQDGVLYRSGGGPVIEDGLLHYYYENGTLRLAGKWDINELVTYLFPGDNSCWKLTDKGVYRRQGK